MGVVPAERRSREAHAPSRRPAPSARPAGLPDGPIPAPLSRAARTAGLSLAALGALAGAGGVATANLSHADEAPTTGEFALPTNLVSADMSLAAPAHQAFDVAAPAVMPAMHRAAATQAAPAIKTSSPASRAAAAERSAQGAKAAKAASDARQAKAASAASSSIGAKVVALAKGQLGVPYEWGGTTPSGFDCSGLMQWAYGKVGKDLPRTSAAQAQEGKKVSMSNLQPGDLVFMYSPVSHVAMYAGNGQIVEAPTEGEDVKMTPISKYEDKIVEARRL